MYIFRGDFHNLLIYNRLYCHAMACASRLHDNTNDCRSKSCKTRSLKMYKVELKTNNQPKVVSRISRVIEAVVEELEAVVEVGGDVAIDLVAKAWADGG